MVSSPVIQEFLTKPSTNKGYFVLNNPINPTPEYCVCISMSKLENLITITELYVEKGISRINDGLLSFILGHNNRPQI